MTDPSRQPEDRSHAARPPQLSETVTYRPPGESDTAGSTDADLRVSLKVTAGPQKGRVFSFVGHDTFLIGRSKWAHFRLSSADRYVSRIHFVVEVNPPLCRLMDMGSRNGTMVNGNKVQQADLQNGDKVRVGRTVLQVSFAPDAIARANRSPRQDPSSGVKPRAKPAGLPPLPRARSAGFAPGTCAACGIPMPARVPEGGTREGPSELPFCPACRTALRSRPQPIDGHVLIHELGHGAMGVVYLALCRRDSCLVALKTITTDADAPDVDARVARFLREAAILRQLEHPHVVRYHDLGEADGLPYLTMDYVLGKDAAQLLKEHGGPLPVPRAVGWACQVLEALEYTHARRFVHRDIKPSNVLVTTEGGREVVKLLDFGLARVYQATQLSGLTLTGEVGGTIGFLPPEQITNFRGALPATDQYAVGATLYYLLTNCYLFDFPAHPHERLLKILLDRPVPPAARRPDLPPGLCAVVERMLARELAERYPGVREARLALQPYLT